MNSRHGGAPDGPSSQHFYLDPKFWVAVAFVIFLLLVGRMAWARLTGMLDARAEG